MWRKRNGDRKDENYVRSAQRETCNFQWSRVGTSRSQRIIHTIGKAKSKTSGKNGGDCIEDWGRCLIPQRYAWEAERRDLKSLDWSCQRTRGDDKIKRKACLGPCCKGLN